MTVELTESLVDTFGKESTIECKHVGYCNGSLSEWYLLQVKKEIKDIKQYKHRPIWFEGKEHPGFVFFQLLEDVDLTFGPLPGEFSHCIVVRAATNFEVFKWRNNEKKKTTVAASS